MAKNTPHIPATENRKHLSRRAKEQRQRKMVLWGAGGVLVLIVLILGWGIYDQYVLRPKQPVATVGGVPIRLDTYQKLVVYRRWDYRSYLDRLEAQRQQLAASQEDTSFLLQYIAQQIQQVQQQLVNMPMQVLDEMIDDQITRQEAAARGIAVTPDEVQIRMEEQFGYERNPPTPTPVVATEPITVTPTPTVAPMTEAEYQEQATQWFETTEKAAGFGRADFERLVENTLYREKLEEALSAEAPTTGEQVKARHILVETLEEAQSVIERLNAGESFEDLAAEVSIDDSNKDDGGDLGWFGRGQMVTEFEDAAFALSPGELSEPVETSFGYHIIRVDDYDANRELDETSLAQTQQEYIDNWYAEREASDEVVRSWDSTMIPEDTYTSSVSY